MPGTTSTERLGPTIKRLRARRGLSRVELQRLLAPSRAYPDSHPGTVNRIETGSRAGSIPTLGRIADALGLSPAERVELIEAAGFPIGGATPATTEGS